MENPLNDKKINVPYMRTLAQAGNKLLQEGFVNNFMATEEGLKCQENSTVYQPSQMHVVNFYRFEGISDPSDNSILYAIETSDGVKGTLADAYGVYSDPLVDKFMKQVKIEERE